MKVIIAYWKKDILNKFILIVSMGLGIGVLLLIYLLATISRGSVFYTMILPENGGVPTLVPPAATETTVFTPTTEYFPSMTPFASATTTGTVLPTKAFPTPTATWMAAAARSISTPTPVHTTLSTLVACIPNNPPQSGKVLDVIDGNTIKVYMEGKVYVVRYIGIAVPRYGEAEEPYGQAAQIRNSRLVFGQQISLIKDTSDKDSVGRLLRYVIANGVFVNLKLVEQGWASSLEAPPDTACAQTFKDAEQTARQTLVGRWATNPTPSH